MTTSKIILKVLESEPNKWFKSYELNQQSTAFGWIGSAGSRRARELAAKGLIEVRHVGKYSEYRHRQLEIAKPVMSVAQVMGGLQTKFSF